MRLVDHLSDGSVHRMKLQCRIAVALATVVCKETFLLQGAIQLLLAEGITKSSSHGTVQNLLRNLCQQSHSQH